MLLLYLQLTHVLSLPLIMHYDQCLSFIGTERERVRERERAVNKKNKHPLFERAEDREREKESKRVRYREREGERERAVNKKK